jgi:16S rRNA (uracil1498-N3)-methyltransferase
MNRYFIRHKLSIGDITHLSDSDGDIVKNKTDLDIEDVIEIETYDKIFLAQITDIDSSVEIEILEEIESKERMDSVDITVIQSLSNDSKFNLFLEKSVEIGVDRIIPVESKYSLKNRNKALKDTGLWRKIVKDSTEQSRNLKPTIVEKPIKIKDLLKEKFNKEDIKICLATESIDTILLNEYLKDIDINKPFVVAIGPEKGWSSSDIEVFEQLDFDFVKLDGNILRTETAGLVITSILKYLKGEI